MIYNMNIFKSEPGEFRLGIEIFKSYSHEENDTYSRFWSIYLNIGRYQIWTHFKTKQIRNPHENTLC